MWPTCLDDLLPFPRPLGAEPPADLVEAFRQAGWPEAALPVRLVALLGTCATHQYKGCPTLPETYREYVETDGAGSREQFGRYYWCDFDLIDRKGAAVKLRMAFNQGDPDCNDGIWGVVWDRDTAEVVAEMRSIGDCEGRIRVVSSKHSQAFANHPHPIPTDRALFPSCPLPCTVLYARNQQFAQLVGVAMRWCYFHA